MILASAKINNYKSIGTKNNVLYTENTVTALIGKNESGKSNVLEALGLINLWQPLNTDYLKKLTHGQSEPPSVSLIFSFSAKDKETFPTAEGTSTLIYTGTKVSLEGGLSNLISQDMTLASNIESLQTVIRNNELKLDNTTLNTLKNHTTKLATLSENIYSSIFSELDSAKSLIRGSKENCKTSFLELVDDIKEIIRKYYNMIPQVYYRSNDSMLKDSYSLDEIKKIYEVNRSLTSSKDTFFNLMKAAEVDEATLLGAFEASTDSAKHTFEKQIEKRITNLVKEFNEFYRQELISIDFKISSNVAKLYIFTDDKYMSFSERSNGLKWYFSLYVNVTAETSIARPILYLLDEPGVYLHVKAQKKLLELFDHLCQDNNQVIYTTHSPFMIDGNNIFNIRPIEKDENGISHIWRSTSIIHFN